MHYYLIAGLVVFVIVFLLFFVWWYCYCHNEDCEETICDDKMSMNYVFYNPHTEQRSQLVGMKFVVKREDLKNYKFVFYNELDLVPSDYPNQIFIAWDTSAYNSLEAQINKLKNENQSLTGRLSSLQSASSGTRDFKYVEGSDENIIMLQNMIDDLKIERDEFRKQKEESDIRFEEAQQEIKELVSIGDELEREKDVIGEQLKAKSNQYDEAVKVIQTYERLNSNKIDTVQEIVSLQYAISDNEKAIKNMEQLIDSLKGELEFKNEQLNELSKTNDALVENNNKLMFDIDKWKHHVVSQGQIITQLQSGKVSREINEKIKELNVIDKQIKESILSEQAQTRGLSKIGHILEAAVASIYSLAPSSAFGQDDEDKIDSLVKQGSKVIIGIAISEEIKQKYKSVRFIDLADPALYTTLFRVIMTISSGITIIVSSLAQAREVEKRFYPLNVNAVLFDDELDIFQILDKPGVVHIVETLKTKIYNLIKLRGQRIIAHIIDTYVHQIVAQLPDLFPKYTALISNLLYRGSGVKLARSFSGKIEIRDMTDINKTIVYIAQPDSSLEFSEIKLLGDKFGLNIITITLDYNDVDKDFECLHRLYDCGIRVFIGARSTFEVEYEAIKRLQELYPDVVIISEGSNIGMKKQNNKVIRLLESERVIAERVFGHLKTIKIKDDENDEIESDAQILFVTTPRDYTNDKMNVIIIDEEDEINIDDLAQQFIKYDVIAFNATVSELFYDNIQYFPDDKLYVRYNDSCIHTRLMYKMKELDIDYNDVVPITKDGKNAQIIEAIMYSSFIINMTDLSFDKIIDYSNFLRGPHEAIQLDKNGDRIDQSLAMYKLIKNDVKIECIIPKLHYKDDAPACLINL